MVTDEVMVALIRESVVASSDARRTAARLLLDALRSGSASGLDAERAEVVRAERGAEVAREWRELASRFGLARVDADAPEGGFAAR